MRVCIHESQARMKSLQLYVRLLISLFQQLGMHFYLNNLNDQYIQQQEVLFRLCQKILIQ